VIATNNGGTPEIVADGETGLLFEYANAEELAAKIGYLLTHRDLMKRMGIAGRKRVEKNFTIEKNIQETQKEYMKLLEVKTC